MGLLWIVGFLIIRSPGLVSSSGCTSDTSKTQGQNCSLHLICVGLRTPCRNAVLWSTPMHPLRPDSSRNKVSGWWWGARSSYSEWPGIWWGDLSKIGNRRRITAGKQAGEQSNLEAGLFFELCGREATVYMQSCWLKTLRIRWRVESGRFQI